MNEIRPTRRGFLAAGMAALGLPLMAEAARAAAYKELILAGRPAGYWRLGERAGTSAADSSGNGHGGAYLGRPALGQPGAIHGDPDTAVGLDGKADSVQIPGARAFSQPTSGKGLTVEVWMRPDALEFTGAGKDDYIHWLSKGDPGQEEWALRFYSKTSKDRPNRISAYIFNPKGGLGAGAFFQDRLVAGEWLHIVACFEPGDAGSAGKPGVRIYKNGELRQGPPAPGTLYNTLKWKIRPTHGPAPVRLGASKTKGHFKGALDEVAIYPRVLSAREVMEHYRAGKGR
jgi:hypothetical protein